MSTILNALRQILGTPNFYTQSGVGGGYTWDYGAMLEYAIAGILLCTCVSYVFRLVKWLFSK